ncbi:hypothetical protein FY048_13030 [Acinetobacter sp. 1124_18A]|uniref:hypothetical protein n=1 Tax=Acinetobacter sp. 1124_18A TaxID=2605958 RepID=UPI004058288E
MKFSTSLTNDELENLYKNLDSNVLNLPVNFKKLRLGLLPRVCQALITALKYKPTKVVKFFQFDSTKDEAITELLQHPECLTALLMSDQVYEKDKVFGGEKIEVELKSKINRDIQLRLNQTIFQKQHRIQMFAVDHSIKKYAFPSCFYFPEGSNTLNTSEFYTSLLNKIIKHYHPKTKISNQETSSLAMAIHELIENTEQHGKIEFNTGKVKKSVRGLIIDYKFIPKTHTLESISGINTPMTDYLNATRKDKGTLYFLEISIFDSGEGILKTFRSNSDDSLDLKKEVEIVENSFTKGVTSKAESQGYGRGLHNVRTVLDNRNGFLSLRTGRVSLYRDFNLHPLTENDQTPLSLFDEISKSNAQYNELAHAEGLALSILVPLR